MTRFNSASAWWIAGGTVFHLLLLLVVAARYNGLENILHVHDAGFYITHLRDPFLLGEIPEFWDNVPYRGLRIGYVIAALPFRWLGEIPALATVNLLAVAIGIKAVWTIAERHGTNPRIAVMVWILNPGALIATVLLLPDTIAWTAILLALLAVESRSWLAATLLGVFAVATKEASLAALGMAGLVGFRRDWRAIVPVAAGVTWHFSYLTILVARFGEPFHSTFLSAPFAGWVEAWVTGWDGRAVSRVVGLLVLVSGLLVLLALWRRRSSIYLAAAAGQVFLMFGLARQVLIPMSNSTRIGGLFWPMLVACCASLKCANQELTQESVPARAGLARMDDPAR